MSDCPKCGCNRSEVVRTIRVWGQRREVRQCDHCGQEFRAYDPPPPVPEERTCPACGSPRFLVYWSKDGLQYRKCEECSHTAKTVI
jgi:Zn ribbon nucleic-acid-binding protein